VPVEVIAPKLEIKSLSPASVTLSIERVEERSVPVTLHYTAARCAEHRRAARRRAADRLVATLRAPTSDLARVAGVRVDVPFPSSPSAVRRDAPARRDGTPRRRAAGISVSPNLVRVRARFRRAAARK
jgi:hypothetical protein